MTDYDKYNGWTNRETWALNLWLTNDQGLYEMTRERVRECIAAYRENDPYPSWCVKDYEQKRWDEHRAGDIVRELWEELSYPSEAGDSLESLESKLDMVRDVGSDYRVDWDEIGAYWLSDSAEDTE